MFGALTAKLRQSTVNNTTGAALTAPQSWTGTYCNFIIQKQEVFEAEVMNSTDSTLVFQMCMKLKWRWFVRQGPINTVTSVEGHF